MCPFNRFETASEAPVYFLIVPTGRDAETPLEVLCGLDELRDDGVSFVKRRLVARFAFKRAESNG